MSATATRRVFISYRRSDAAPHAIALRAEFERRLASAYVFLDTQKIEVASQWPARLQDELFQCDAFISLIGPAWITAQNDAGQLRLFDAEDWVRRENAYVLQHKPACIVPVAIDDTVPPGAGSLPSDLKALADFQFLRIATERWDAGVAELNALLCSRLGFALRSDNFSYPKADDFVAGTPAVSAQRLAQALAAPQLEGWAVEGTDNPAAPDRMWLVRSYLFSGFGTALKFMTEMAPYCRAMRHHPRWENVHREVRVRLSTFDAGFKITELDLSMAVEMNKVAARLAKPG